MVMTGCPDTLERPEVVKSGRLAFDREFNDSWGSTKQSAVRDPFVCCFVGVPLIHRWDILYADNPRSSW